MKLLFGVLLILVLPLEVLTNAYNPGDCERKSRGKFFVVKDRKDDDKILVCVKHDDKYQWRSMDGRTYGEYFNPAEDCTDVVNNVPVPESGIYWIKTKNGLKKAWCDVDTDGGGYMLIGVKDTPVSWAIPSDPTVVLPQGKVHWSSAFGDKQVLDFRVQISTTKSFKDTQSHWSYRFHSPRNLTSLLLRASGNCSRHYPGVGDVKYVKDLKNNQIVTTRFQCSRFGSHFLKTLGWGKMNACFGKSCGKGFAHIGSFRYDSAGSFSYSVVSSRSGILHNSTAFLGCDHGKCCACFGPTSDRDYCAPPCKAINGGTVLWKKDAIHAWFWIRSSLPKRVWKKCMQYNDKNDAGKLETWHIEEGVMRKGPCSYPGDVHLHEGIAVVPDKQSLDHLPSIQGLLSYRSDNRKLYIKGRKEWNIIGRHREIEDNKNMIEKMEKELKLLTSASCKRILEINKDAKNGVYKVITDNGFTQTYCQMTSLPGCSGSGWTMVMKMDGRKSTFKYSSSYWTNKESFNGPGGLTGFDNHETKLPTFWSTSFKELCVGMKVGNDLRFVSINYPAASLYSLFADNQYRATNIGRARWKSLISGSSLQRNCNREGFNIRLRYINVRLGIESNEQNDCASPDSYIGLGSSKAAAGNWACCTPDNGDKNTKAMGYILVR